MGGRTPASSSKAPASKNSSTLMPVAAASTSMEFPRVQSRAIIARNLGDVCAGVPWPTAALTGRCWRVRKKKRFFFEKKNQKTFSYQ
jgi:hypothetical protein